MLWPEKSTSDGQPVGPIICIGPVSLPMAAFVPCASAAIWNRDVCPVRLRISGQIVSIFDVTSFSASVPKTTTWYPFVMSRFASAP